MAAAQSEQYWGAQVNNLSGGGGGGGGATAAPTPTVMDLTARGTVTENACAASGTASVTCSNAVAGDLLLVVASDCQGTSTQTCPSGFTSVVSSGTGGTTVTVCSKIAVGGDNAVAQKITANQHTLTENCYDFVSTGASTITIQANQAVSGLTSNTTAGQINSPIPTNLEVNIIGAQTAVPTLTAPYYGYNLSIGGSVALQAVYAPVASGSLSTSWTANGSASQTNITLLISG